MFFSEINEALALFKWFSRRFMKSDPEVMQKVSEMQSLLLSLQSALLEQSDKFRELLADYDVLKKSLDHRSKLVRRQAYYEFADPVEGYGQGPFCLHCTDIKGFPVGVPVNHIGQFTCSSCNATGWLDGKHEKFAAEVRARNEANERECKRFRL